MYYFIEPFSNMKENIFLKNKIENTQYNIACKEMKLMKLAKIFVSGVNGPSSGDLVLVCVQWPHSNDPGDNGAV